MYIHIGSGMSVRAEEVVCVIDLERDTTSEGVKRYMKRMQEEGRVRQAGDELPKALVVTCGKNGQICNVSPVSVRTLKARFEETEDMKLWKRRS